VTVRCILLKFSSEICDCEMYFSKICDCNKCDCDDRYCGKGKRKKMRKENENKKEVGTENLLLDTKDLVLSNPLVPSSLTGTKCRII